MTVVPQLTVALHDQADIVGARQRGRQLAELLGFDKQDQTRVATAVSEIARNALMYGGGGRVELAVETEIDPRLIVRVNDAGPGIADVPGILDGRYRSDTGMGLGIVGTRRLMDLFDLTSGPKGTKVTFAKRLPSTRKLSRDDLDHIGRTLAATTVADPLVDARLQNLDLIESLAALAEKQEETKRLNAELESTNRGVVALHAELEEKAAALAELNAGLEARVAAAVTECQQVNDALRQSQKMEAVGQLTGGIAHDFNNLLQIITGNLDILLRSLPDDAGRARRAAGNAMTGAMRAATLTQRLLAFSRRQPLAPKPLHPNRLVEGMLELVRRALSEQITTHVDLAGDLWLIEADANQLENAVLNLAVNARDAMAHGGRLTITTGNTVVSEADAEGDAVPGHYVSLAVCDTGAGMSDDTLARVLEPFFTTKEVGKGTGLGLSMVYGFVKQSGGHLRIESSLGRGTTVTLFLPRLTGAGEGVPEALGLECQPVDGRSPAGARAGETILLVEDDGEVRDYSASVLAELGYVVLNAADGAAAMTYLDADGRIDLVFTDVILTGSLTGRDVADHALKVRPGTPVLFTSGYARDAIFHDDRLDEGIHLLAKPFTLDQLASSIRALLSPAEARVPV